jgi:hypothetical protein
VNEEMKSDGTLHGRRPGSDRLRKTILLDRSASTTEPGQQEHPAIPKRVEQRRAPPIGRLLNQRDLRGTPCLDPQGVFLQKRGTVFSQIAAVSPRRIRSLIALEAGP